MTDYWEWHKTFVCNTHTPTHTHTQHIQYLFTHLCFYTPQPPPNKIYNPPTLDATHLPTFLRRKKHKKVFKNSTAKHLTLCNHCKNISTLVFVCLCVCVRRRAYKNRYSLKKRISNPCYCLGIISVVLLGSVC